MREQHVWLSEPRTTLFFDPSGQPEGAYIEFRTGKTVRTEQPSEAALVFLCLGYDDQPVGVKMIGPAPENVRAPFSIACLRAGTVETLATPMPSICPCPS